MTLHSRNRHHGRYDFQQLTETCPELIPFLVDNPIGDQSIDFSNPSAVKELNRALLKHYYGVASWDVPPGYLCPPIPGRADYIHNIADLLAYSSGDDEIPRGAGVRVLDIGVGANCVYPIIGHAEYGWSFVGTEMDPIALESARKIVQANPQLKNSVELRLQKEPAHIFEGIIQEGEQFALSICNPPFHRSLEEAQAGSLRKWKNLGREDTEQEAPVLNFGGQGTELWCEGGEFGFVSRMIKESMAYRNQCTWFSTLISKGGNLHIIEQALNQAKVSDMKLADMGQGQKISRLIAWTYQ